jgi:FKBP-type peptidyl-prolyl cis-trans isomerase
VPKAGAGNKPVGDMVVVHGSGHLIEGTRFPMIQ